MPPKPFDIKLKLRDDERARIGQDIKRKITSARNGMTQMLTDIQLWRDLYEGFLPPKSTPWELCSNVNIPVIQPHVDTLHSHINTVILTVSPITLIGAPPALGDGAKEIGKRVEDYLEYVQTKIMNVEECSDETFLEALLTPTAVEKLIWCEDYRTVRLYEQETQEDPNTGESVVVQKSVEQQAPKHVGPKKTLVDLANFVIYPLRSRIESAQLVGDRYTLSPDDVRRRVKNKKWDEAALDCLKSPRTEASTFADDNSTDELNREGLEPTDAEILQFWEVITGYDYNGDGLLEDCVFVIEEGSGVICSATKFPYSHGRCYYIPYCPFPRPRKFFGRAVPMILEGIQREINTIHNQRSDSLSLAISRVFLMRKGSQVDPDNLSVYPGAVIPVDSVDDIKEVDVNPNIPGADMEEMLRQYGERATGINDVSSGRGNDGDKTLGEVAIVNAEGGVRFGEMIRRLQNSMVEASRQTLWLCYQFAPDEELAAFGLKREDLVQPWDIMSHGNSSTANKIQIRQEANLLYNTLAKNPLIIQDVKRVWKLTRDYLLAYDRTDVENYIGTEEDIDKALQAGQQQQIQQIVAAMSTILKMDPLILMQAAQQAEQMIGAMQNGNPGGPGSNVGGPGGPVAAGAGSPGGQNSLPGGAPGG